MKYVTLGAAALAIAPALALAQTVQTTPPTTTPSAVTPTAPMPTPPSLTTRPALPPSASTSVVVGNDALRISKVIGYSVYNDAGDDIGKVDDIMLPTGAAPVAILSVGGFLGVGSHYVAVPLNSIHLGARDRWTMTGATKDSIRALPQYTYPASR
jgi:sporulation protein YlmC with PRC-barrel domain